MAIGIICAHDYEFTAVQIFAALQAAQALNVKVVAHCRAGVFVATDVLFAFITLTDNAAFQV